MIKKFPAKQQRLIILKLFFRKVHVMYVATVDGYVKKISILPRTQETCVVEVWRASPPHNADSHILALRYLKETDSVSIFFTYVFK